MPLVTAEHIARLQRNPRNIRNICVLAHVDHGKTSLSDNLIASNAIISHRQAGKVRYLDSRPDEQLRGITMKASMISLLHEYNSEQYLVNLIDSPGHVDFASEVSTAVRLCDGALVLVDVCEGVCPQTYSVIRQAYHENIKPVLVLNKMDRLFTELKLSPMDALMHLQKILEQVNAAMATLFTAELMEKAAKATDESGAGDDETHTNALADEDDSHLYFEPERGNVVFASAMDGFGFGIEHFAVMFAEKLGCKVDVLRKTLWGDYYFDAKAKKILKGAYAKGKKPLFVQFVLETLHNVYNTVLSGDKEKTEKVASVLNMKILPRDMKAGVRPLLQAILRQWLPLSTAVLDMVAAQLPSPLDLPEERAVKLYYGPRVPSSLPAVTQALFPLVRTCATDTPDGQEAPLIAYVSKMESFDWDALPSNRLRQLTPEEMAEKRAELLEKRRLNQLATPEPGHSSGSSAATSPQLPRRDPGVGTPIPNPSPLPGEDSNERDEAAADGDSAAPMASANEALQTREAECLIGFARIYCGTLKVGQTLHALGPKYSPFHRGLGAHNSMVTISSLYIVMGKDLEADAAPALAALFMPAAPILRVAVEPSRIGDMPKLVNGLRMLNQADSLVEIMHTEKGEHVLHTAGEVHLERCLKDLQERYAKCAIRKSSPIVPFRETVVLAPKTDMVNESIAGQSNPSRATEKAADDEETSEDYVDVYAARRAVRIRLRALPLPATVLRVLDEHEDLLRTVFEKKQGTANVNERIIGNEISFRDKLAKAFTELTGDERELEWEADIVDKILSLGPRRVGPNMLVNRIPGYSRPPSIPDPAHIHKIEEDAEGSPHFERNAYLDDLHNSIVSGFQLATAAGPLCEEPMRGVCLELVDFEVLDTSALPLPARVAGPAVRIEAAPSEAEPDSDTEADDEGEEIESAQTSRAETPVDDVSSAPAAKQTGAPGKSAAGQVITAVKEGCRRALLSNYPRLMVAMYACEIQAPSEVLGLVYGVVSRREGRILNEEMREGTPLFVVQCVMPVVHSFGFADEIRKRTSGTAFPQLVFSHWETLPIDPFWMPSTEEELTHFGDTADSENPAQKLMNEVRQRKGLHVQKKIVEHAEKQRTMSRKK